MYMFMFVRIYIRRQCTCFILGDIILPVGVILTVHSDLNGASPRFTLTCISTGGPATTVTWTRDSDTVTEVTETVLDNPVTAQYTHTLTVTGRLGGLYTCTVANVKPSERSATYTVQGMSLLSLFKTFLVTVLIVEYCRKIQPITDSVSVLTLGFSCSEFIIVWNEDTKISPTAQCTCSHISTPSQTLTKDIHNSICIHAQYLSKDYTVSNKT